MEEENDESLATRLLMHDRKAFSTLVHRNTQKFYRVAWRMTGNAAEAEEIVQEAFLKLWERPHMWKAEKKVKFSTWFSRVIINLAIDRNRKNRFTNADITLAASQDTNQEENIILNEKQKLVETAIQKLPERQKAALNLCYYEEKSNIEAAEIMGVGIKALESLLSRAKATLRAQFSNIKEETTIETKERRNENVRRVV